MPDVTDLLAEAVRRWPAARAVRDAHGCDTYADLAAAANRVAAGLWARGVRPGDRVLVHLAAGRDFARVLFGVLRAGATAVPVHPATGPFHLSWMIRDAEPAIVVSEDFPVESPVEVRT